MYEQRFETQHSSAMDFGPYGLGATTNHMQNQLMTANLGMNWGVRNLELGFMGSQWEGAPLGKLSTLEREEIIHLAKLNNVNLTIHGPYVDPAGFNSNSHVFDETERINAVQEFKQAISFADQIGTKNNVQHIPVVMHGANAAPGNPNPNEILYYADRETGGVGTLQSKGNYISKELAAQYLDPNTMKTDFKPKEGHPDMGLLSPHAWLRLHEERTKHEIGVELANIDYHLEILAGQMDRAIKANESKRIELMDKERQALIFQKEMKQTQMNHLEQEYIEQGKNRLVPAEQMAIEKVAQTTAELAVFSYGTQSQPTIAIENIYPNMALSKIEDLNATIKLAREQFVDKMSPKIGGDAARQAAENLIGSTLDIGHLNMWTKYRNPETITPDNPQGSNYTKEDIERWAMDAKRYVKHIHLTDNFGDADAHLPVGWGNAPIKEVVEKYKKDGFKGDMILETPGVGEQGHQMMVGIPASFDSLNYQLNPSMTWHDAVNSYFQAGYAFTGFQTLPDVTFQMYGAGFSGLPYGTGAVMPGKGDASRLSGAPMS
ncbi:MAG: TIM barrel protein [Candidatus Nanoarchaeia archaeon]|nr:TIM barrel protein [Candidatus Nanoarchaeia archaeon]MDD5239750.1 TIM barrel protein [Candidatus Nanoarchaeia archaeon]